MADGEETIWRWKTTHKSYAYYVLGKHRNTAQNINHAPTTWPMPPVSYWPQCIKVGFTQFSWFLLSLRLPRRLLGIFYICTRAFQYIYSYIHLRQNNEIRHIQRRMLEWRVPNVPAYQPIPHYSRSNPLQLQDAEIWNKV